MGCRDIETADASTPGDTNTLQDISSDSSQTQHNTNEKDYEVRFTGDDDSQNPKSMPLWRKWLTVSIISTTGLCVACTSSLYTGTYHQLEEEFGSSRITATLGLTTFVIGLGLSPMVLAPLSEVSKSRSLTRAAYLIHRSFMDGGPSISSQLCFSLSGPSLAL